MIYHSAVLVWYTRFFLSMSLSINARHGISYFMRLFQKRRKMLVGSKQYVFLEGKKKKKENKTKMEVNNSFGD